MIFKDGELVEFYLETEQGIINFASDVKLESDTLILYNILIYGNKNFPLKGNIRLFLKLRDELKALAKQDGFKKIILIGYRSKRSSSANPNRDIILTINLTDNDA
jgi:hypothetical protein